MNPLFNRSRFAYQTHKDENEFVFYLSGILDHTGGSELRDELSKKIDNCKAVVFNMGEIRIVSSGGMSALVDIARFLEQQQIRFRLIQPSEMVLRTLKVVHVDRLIEIQI